MIGWVDIETTGLDPFADDAAVLEVAIVATNDNLDVIAHHSLVVATPRSAVDKFDEFITKMHTENCLIDEITAADVRSSSLRQVERSLVNFMTFHFTEPPIMGGATVNFDRAWLAEFMPDLFNKFHYRNLDVSSLREAARRWRPDLTDVEPSAIGSHRALDDIHDTIGLARFYQSHIFNKESK